MRALLTFDRADGLRPETIEINLMDQQWPDEIRHRLAQIRPDQRIDCVTITRAIPLQFVGRETERRAKPLSR